MENVVYTCKYQSPLGDILLAADEIGLTGYGLKDRNILLIHFPHVCSGSWRCGRT